MSSNLSLSPFSHRPLNSAGAQQDRPPDASSKIPGLFDNLQLSPSMGSLEFELSELDIEQISPPPLEKKDSFIDFGEDIFLQKTPFEDLCLGFSMEETDLGPLRERFTRFDSVVALYNDFDGQKRRVRNINEVFREVFTKLQAGDGFEGRLGAFFVVSIGHLTQSSLISSHDDSNLRSLALQYRSRLQDPIPPVSVPRRPNQGLTAQRYKDFNRADFGEGDESIQFYGLNSPIVCDGSQKSRGRKALEDKGWLVAAMVLGLMASYPLILKPTCQAAGDLIRRMRGFSVPKVQG